MKLIILLLFAFVVCCLARNLGADLERRIVGGDFAAENQFPHQIAITQSGYLRCGGSIIHESWVLTAAHCLLSKLEA